MLVCHVAEKASLQISKTDFAEATTKRYPGSLLQNSSLNPLLLGASYSSLLNLYRMGVRGP